MSAILYWLEARHSSHPDSGEGTRRRDEKQEEEGAQPSSCEPGELLRHLTVDPKHK